MLHQSLHEEDVLNILGVYSDGGFIKRELLQLELSLYDHHVLGLHSFAQTEHVDHVPCRVAVQRHELLSYFLHFLNGHQGSPAYHQLLLFLLGQHADSLLEAVDIEAGVAQVEDVDGYFMPFIN